MLLAMLNNRIYVPDHLPAFQDQSKNLKQFFNNLRIFQ